MSPQPEKVVASPQPAGNPAKVSVTDQCVVLPE